MYFWANLALLNMGKLRIWITAGLMLWLAPAAIFAQQPKTLSVEKIFASGEFFPKFAPDMVHMKDGEHYCTLDEEGISIYDYVKGKS